MKLRGQREVLCPVTRRRQPMYVLKSSVGKASSGFTLVVLIVVVVFLAAKMLAALVRAKQ